MRSVCGAGGLRVLRRRHALTVAAVLLASAAFAKNEPGGEPLDEHAGVHEDMREKPGLALRKTERGESVLALNVCDFHRPMIWFAR